MTPKLKPSGAKTQHDSPNKKSFCLSSRVGKKYHNAILSIWPRVGYVLALLSHQGSTQHTAKLNSIFPPQMIRDRPSASSTDRFYCKVTCDETTMTDDAKRGAALRAGVLLLLLLLLKNVRVLC